ncbi:MAG: prepilin-type N-terminal cleavage/methylation domain-containing protein [Lentisphaeraceae bacterium]|nr:prepilin-type N-terminal cleavage/methylation domain-containing protein [Lentisphaeraceae bacterium]
MRKNFTLLELLIVIAIIAILLSLLLPSLGKARFQTKVAVCMSYQKQWGTTTFLYTKNNEGRFNNDEPVSSARSLHDMAYSWVNPLIDDYGFPVDSFFCPLREDEYSGKDWLYKNASSARIGFGYWVYRWAGNGTSVFSDAIVAKNSSDNILFSDNVVKNNGNYVNGFGTLHLYNGNHVNMNITFADNHIENLKAAQTYPVYTTSHGRKNIAINRVD